MSERTDVTVTGSDNRRDEEDAAAVVTVLALLAQSADPETVDDRPVSLWGDPAHQLRQPSAASDDWWASGMPR